MIGQDRIVVTGGAGFLGKHLQTVLRVSGVPEQNLLVPLIEDFDLTCEADVARMYREMKPDVVIHLAALVGGIGANRANPGLHRRMECGLLYKGHDYNEVSRAGERHRRGPQILRPSLLPTGLDASQNSIARISDAPPALQPGSGSHDRARSAAWELEGRVGRDPAVAPGSEANSHCPAGG